MSIDYVEGKKVGFFCKKPVTDNGVLSHKYG